MDQEDCSKQEAQSQSLTKSTARHIRRARLKNALKAGKEHSSLPNGDNGIIAKKEQLSENLVENHNGSKDTLSKSKAKRLRKKNKNYPIDDVCPLNKNSPTPFSHADLIRAKENSEEKIIRNNVQEEADREKEPFELSPTSDQKNRESSEIVVHRETVAIDAKKCKLPQWPTTGSEFGEKILDEDKLNKEAEESIATQMLRESSSIESQTELKAVVESKIPSNMVAGKENTPGKTKEEIKAEREARRAAKVKAKTKDVKNEDTQELIDKKPLESTAAEASSPTESQTASLVKDEKAEAKITESKSSKEDIKAQREARRAAKVAAKAKGKGGKTVDATEPKTSQATPATQVSSDSSGTVIKEVADVTTEVEKADKSSAKEQPTSVTKNDDGKSKAELRAERRAKQEAQRAAKQQKQFNPQQKQLQKAPKSEESLPSPASKDTTKKAVVGKAVTPTKNAHEVNLFKHLYHARDLAVVEAPSLNSTRIHPAVVRLGVQYANKAIVGSNARCIALLAALKQLFRDFERPSQADFIRGLESNLQESAAYLHHCRPSSVSMQNALRHLKWQMTQLPSTLSDMEAKSKLESAIETYIKEQIDLAGKAISMTIQRKISNGDIILTYGYSSLINKILLDAHDVGKKFRVIVVDGRPWLEGKEQLRRLANHGIECSYILINALSFVMPEVSKVFLGAHAILANGAVMSRAGTAQVALMAKAFNVPVLVACETHKSCERVQTDSIVYNELGNADELANLISHGRTVKKSPLSNWRTRKSLNLLNITYDVTPADLVTAVVTELAILPCTSVPVILRIKPSEI